jgi:hypothetical protein
MRLLPCLLLLLVAPAVQAQMYKCTEGGRTRYSDKPITDCRNVAVKGQANVSAGTPAPAQRRGPVSKEQAAYDSKCANLRREHQALQRAPDGAKREQRLQEMRADYAACN